MAARKSTKPKAAKPVEPEIPEAAARLSGKYTVQYPATVAGELVVLYEKFDDRVEALDRHDELVDQGVSPSWYVSETGEQDALEGEGSA